MRSQVQSRANQVNWQTFLLLSSLSLAAGVAPVAAQAGNATTLYVTVSNVRNSNGHIRLAVCTEQTFLGANCPFQASAPAQIGAVTLSVEDMTPGVYAVQVFQDEDDSGRIKRSLLGIPEEGFGFSNDASIRFGAPRFSDAAFRLTPDGGRVALHLYHFD